MGMSYGGSGKDGEFLAHAWTMAGEAYDPLHIVHSAVSTTWKLADVLRSARKQGRLDITVLASYKLAKGRVGFPEEELSLDDFLGAITDPVQEGVYTNLNLRVTANGNSAIVHIRYQMSHVICEIFSGDEQFAERVSGMLLRDAPPVPLIQPAPDDKIHVEFSYKNPMGETYNRTLDAPRWAEIAGNYPPGVRDQLARLITSTPEETAGKVAVLHGVPGTGKTSFLRSLTSEWRDKAHLTYIIDTEEFFGDSAYMMNLVMNARSGTWNIFLCEDAEEFLDVQAKKKVGQSLARLLNLGDGMLGQGMKIMLMFTTNVAQVNLNDAITRKGRCFFEGHLRAFKESEASAWMQARGLELPENEDGRLRTYTLAEMYEYANKEKENAAS